VPAVREPVATSRAGRFPAGGVRARKTPNGAKPWKRYRAGLELDERVRSDRINGGRAPFESDLDDAELEVDQDDEGDEEDEDS
jgi:hypothetical protein